MKNKDNAIAMLDILIEFSQQEIISLLMQKAELELKNDLVCFNQDTDYDKEVKKELQKVTDYSIVRTAIFLRKNNIKLYCSNDSLKQIMSVLKNAGFNCSCNEKGVIID